MVINNPLHFRIDEGDPRLALWNAIRQFIKDDAKWLPAYDKVAEWLGDNRSRGLICIGTCGLGKSVICAQALPLVFQYFLKDVAVKVVTAVEMNTQIDELLKFCGQKSIIIVDDLGTEAPETVTYGNRRRPFCELVDMAERTGTLLVITTNLRTTRHATIQYPSIEERYGIPTLDRLKAITTVAVFKGESLRG